MLWSFALETIANGDRGSTWCHDWTSTQALKLELMGTVETIAVADWQSRGTVVFEFLFVGQ